MFAKIVVRPLHIGHTYDNLAKLWFDTQTSTDWRSVLYATNMHSADHPHECGARFPSVFIHEGFTLRRAFKTDALSDGDSMFGTDELRHETFGTKFSKKYELRHESNFGTIY